MLPLFYDFDFWGLDNYFCPQKLTPKLLPPRNFGEAKKARKGFSFYSSETKSANCTPEVDLMVKISSCADTLISDVSNEIRTLAIP